MPLNLRAFAKVNPWNWLRELSGQDIGIYPFSGTPANGTFPTGTGANILGTGAIIIDITSGSMFINVGDKTTVVWNPFAGTALVNSPLADGNILIGDAGDLAQAHPVTGVITMSNTGVTTFPSGVVDVGALAPNALQYAAGGLSSADITGTNPGQLGHADGVTLVAGFGAGSALQLIAFGLYYTFATAAYTAGGDLSINWGAGGAALSGVISAANSVGAASNKANLLYPLSTAGVPLVSNAALNLVSSVAFTNPGTAAGSITWELWYRVMSVGF